MEEKCSSGPMATIATESKVIFNGHTSSFTTQKELYYSVVFQPY